MKFIRGKESQIINLEFVEIIDIIEVEVNGKPTGQLQVQARLREFSCELASFEHVDHAKAYIDKLWSDVICPNP